MIEDMTQVLLAALERGAIALDQSSAQRDLVSQFPVAAQAPIDTTQPSFDQHLLFAIARTARAQPPQPRKQSQREQSAHAMGSKLEWERERLLAASLPALVPRDHPARQPRRKQSREFGHTRLEVIVEIDDLVGRSPHFSTNARPTQCAALQVRHVNDIVEGHPERKETCGLARRGAF